MIIELIRKKLFNIYQTNYAYFQIDNVLVFLMIPKSVSAVLDDIYRTIYKQRIGKFVVDAISIDLQASRQLVYTG